MSSKRTIGQTAPSWLSNPVPTHRASQPGSLRSFIWSLRLPYIRAQSSKVAIVWQFFKWDSQTTLCWIRAWKKRILSLTHKATLNFHNPLPAGPYCCKGTEAPLTLAWTSAVYLGSHRKRISRKLLQAHYQPTWFLLAVPDSLTPIFGGGTLEISGWRNTGSLRRSELQEQTVPFLRTSSPTILPLLGGTKGIKLFFFLPFSFNVIVIELLPLIQPATHLSIKHKYSLWTVVRCW